MRHLSCIKKVLILAGIALGMAPAICVPSAFAETTRGPIKVRVKVESKPEPTKAIGLIISTSDSQEIPETTIEKVGDKLYDISFTVDASTLSEDSVATAMAFNSNGDVVFANVTPALLSGTAASIASIPDCPAEDPSFAIQFNQFGPLQQLVDVRTERAELVRFKISRLLTPEFSQRLTQLEGALGLARPEPLSANLSAAELVDRLSRLDHALKKYKSFKK